MGFLSSLFETRGQVYNPLNPGDPALTQLFGWSQGTASGTMVSSVRAMQHSTVMACIRVLSESVAQLPLNLHRIQPGKGKQVASNHPLQTILNVCPNGIQTPFGWKEMGMQHLLLKGNFFNRIITDNAGNILALMPMHPDRVFVYRGPTGERVYRYIDPTKQTLTLLQSEVLHIMGMPSPILGPDDPFYGLVGLNPIEYAREEIGLAMGMQEFNSRFYKNQSAPRGVLETEGVLSDEGAKRLKTSWEEIHGGPHNAHRVAVLEQGLKFNPIQMNNVDSQFLESRKFQKQEICSIFRVPPHKAADLERSTHSNIEQQNMEFATDALMPWIKRFEEQILIGCLSNRDRLLGYAPEFDLKAMMRADSAARSTYYRQMFAIGCISQNEVREDENMNPIDLGDRYFVPLNMVPTDKLDEFLAQDAPKVGGTPSELGEQGTPDGSAGGQDGSK